MSSQVCCVFARNMQSERGCICAARLLFLCVLQTANPWMHFLRRFFVVYEFVICSKFDFWNFPTFSQFHFFHFVDLSTFNCQFWNFFESLTLPIFDHKFACQTSPLKEDQQRPKDTKAPEQLLPSGTVSGALQQWRTIAGGSPTGAPAHAEPDELLHPRNGDVGAELQR